MKKEIFTWILAMFAELLKVAIVVLVVIALVLAFTEAFSLAPLSFQCATCENRAKVEHGNELHLENGIITEVWVKAGQGCYVPDGVCYAIASGGVGYSFVIVEKIGNGPECQDISHIEVCYDVEPTETPTNTQEPTATSTNVETATPTETQEPSATPTVTPEETYTTEPTETDVPERTPNGNGCG